jgi:hypothetical protein
MSEPKRVMTKWSDEETDEPLIANHRNFYKVEKCSRDGLSQRADHTDRDAPSVNPNPNCRAAETPAGFKRKGPKPNAKGRELSNHTSKSLTGEGNNHTTIARLWDAA